MVRQELEISVASLLHRPVCCSSRREVVVDIAAIPVLKAGLSPSRRQRVPDRQRRLFSCIGKRVMNERLTEEQKAMVEANMRLVHFVVKRLWSLAWFRRYCMGDYSEAFQEGCHYLIKAVLYFDPTRDVAFSTYVTKVIYLELCRKARCNITCIRVPNNAVEAANGKSWASLNPEYIEKAKRATREVINVSSCRHMEDRQYSPARMERDVDRSFASVRVSKLLPMLEPRQREIVRRRVGMAGPAETLEEIGNSLGLSKERVRQVEHDAHDRMRMAVEEF